MIVHSDMRSSDGSYGGSHVCHGSHWCHGGHGSHSVTHTRMTETSHSVSQAGMSEPSHSVTGDHTGFRHGYGHAHESDDL
jgi:hypothetical protein